METSQFSVDSISNSESFCGYKVRTEELVWWKEKDERTFNLYGNMTSAITIEYFSLFLNGLTVLKCWNVFQWCKSLTEFARILN